MVMRLNKRTFSWAKDTRSHASEKESFIIYYQVYDEFSKLKIIEIIYEKTWREDDRWNPDTVLLKSIRVNHNWVTVAVTVLVLTFNLFTDIETFEEHEK